MITSFVDRFESGKEALRAKFASEAPASYEAIVTEVISVITDDEYEANSPDPKRVHQIDDGDYQGTLLFVIAAKGYQPSDYWYVKVGYGSCSGCDTLRAISGYSDEAPTKSQVDDYMTLALHVVQRIKKMGEEVA